jgi:hypothetical protein
VNLLAEESYQRAAFIVPAEASCHEGDESIANESG